MHQDAPRVGLEHFRDERRRTFNNGCRIDVMLELTGDVGSSGIQRFSPFAGASCEAQALEAEA